MKIVKQISEADLSCYLKLSKDNNPLHRQSPGIIPGNLLITILEKIYQDTYTDSPRSISIQFYSPAFLTDFLLIEFSATTFKIETELQKIIAKGVWKNE